MVTEKIKNNIISLSDEIFTDADVTLEYAKNKFSDLIVIGWDKETEQIRTIHSDGMIKKSDVLYLLELAKQQLMEN